jgi:hypothetical protein
MLAGLVQTMPAIAFALSRSLAIPYFSGFFGGDESAMMPTDDLFPKGAAQCATANQ